MLVVCAPIGSAFGDDEAAALITDSLVELDVRIDDADHFITHVSAAANCTVSLDGAVRRNGDTLLYFCTTSGADPEDGLEIARDSAVIERVRLVRTSADERADDRTDDGVESYFEFTYSGPCPVVLLSDHGAEVLELNASDGTTRLWCELSRSADVRRVVESLREGVPGTHLLAKHEGARDRRESNGTSSTVRRSHRLSADGARNGPLRRALRLAPGEHDRGGRRKSRSSRTDVQQAPPGRGAKVTERGLRRSIETNASDRRCRSRALAAGRRRPITRRSITQRSVARRRRRRTPGRDRGSSSSPDRGRT